ncbi:unnamed protein product [Heligmosomoides polygyrus]|uniref:Dolichyl-diphosphooligosaccharide--protein glycosyltransferase subunit DAD1 n=1 Tax=Heligmosomoides polygyrus TaxID=6339 RepID=A0A183GDQ5_HELPZ|nr:unnamed protein product [Heligmosomoides polygyrus]
MQAVHVAKKLYDDYQKQTPSRLKIIDAYMVYILLTGITQFMYCLMVGTFPFNSFLSGFISTVTSFVLASCLRMQVNEENKSEFSHISPERAFADFIFAHVVLHLVVVNFMVADMYMQPLRLVKNALTNPTYFPTYGAYGVSGFMMAVYFCDWELVGQYVPLWGRRFTQQPAPPAAASAE